MLGGYVGWCECWVDMCGGVSVGWIYAVLGGYVWLFECIHLV